MSKARDDRRAEKRTAGNEFYSVELSLPGLTYLYQFSLWDLSTRGLCILVRSDSPVLGFLHAGMVLEMKFYGPVSTEPPRTLNAEIKHLSPDSDGRFRGHVLVGLSILEQEGL
jgi:hypothetical protein